MALTWTITNDARAHLGFSTIMQPAKAVPASADYVTGGYTILPAVFGFKTLRDLQVTGVTDASTITAFYGFQFNPTLGTLQVFVTGTAANDAFNEVAASTDLSAYGFQVIAWGY
jgi:hypothetical protein